MTPEHIEQLRSRVRGAIVQPGDVEYESARSVYNAMIDRRPALIVRCVDEADVIAAVNVARDQRHADRHSRRRPQWRRPGHLRRRARHRSVAHEGHPRRLRGAGQCECRAAAPGGDMDHATHAFGMATPGGTVSTTGVAGLTLGGGIGHLTRPYGLAIDNLLGSRCGAGGRPHP